MLRKVIRPNLKTVSKNRKALLHMAVGRTVPLTCLLSRLPLSTVAMIFASDSSKVTLPSSVSSNGPDENTTITDVTRVSCSLIYLTSTKSHLLVSSNLRLSDKPSRRRGITAPVCPPQCCLVNPFYPPRECMRICTICGHARSEGRRLSQLAPSRRYTPKSFPRPKRIYSTEKRS